MSYYLMLDYDVVLSGEVSEQAPTPGDLMLSELPDFGDNVRRYMVLKQGVLAVQYLQELVVQYGYQIVFHSKNLEHLQLNALAQLRAACQNNGLEFPPVAAIAVLNPQYKGVTSAHPIIGYTATRLPIRTATYGVQGEGKSCVRQALSTLLQITPPQRAQCIVFDADPSIIAAAQAEGYRAFHITAENSLYQTVANVLEEARLSKAYLQKEAA
ncbi:MAG: hypothetical protein K0R24_912, partial [Gammaproteobacteria bacterium]|nr:hypothetical protein [Gammaproteobacteria bacterium]